MGAFYVNCCIRGLHQDEVLALLRRSGRTGFAGPTVDGWTAFVAEDLELQDEAILDRYGEGVTNGSDRVALTVLCHDEDLLRIAVFRGGTKIGWFDSNPAAFRDPGEFDPKTMTFSKPPPTDDECRPTLEGVEAIAEAFGIEPATVMDLLPRTDREAGRRLAESGTLPPDLIAHLQTHGVTEGPLELHERWSATLGLPAYAVGLGFRYVERGEGGGAWTQT